MTDKINNGSLKDCKPSKTVRINAQDFGKYIAMGIHSWNARDLIIRAMPDYDENVDYTPDVDGVCDVTIDDYLSGLRNLDTEDEDRIECFLDCLVYDDCLSCCRNNRDGFKGDLLFCDDGQLIVTTATFISHYGDTYGFKKCIEWIIGAVTSIVANRDKSLKDRDYGPDALRLLADTLQYSMDRDGYTPEIDEFYNKSQKVLLDIDDPITLAAVGYQYYCGEGGKPVDFYKAEKYLSKAFEITGDRDLCRPLGYIAYYGRTNNGVVEGDKAFKYFQMAYDAGLDEGALKLSDCYKHGYGTPIDIKKAKKIIDDDIVFQRFLEEDGDKFTDYAGYASRKAAFLLDGKVTKDRKKKAYSLHLEARHAIKRRMSTVDYAGDEYVATRIYDSITSLEGELNRTVSDKGILLENIYGVISFDMDVLVKMNGKNVVVSPLHSHWLTLPEIGFSSVGGFGKIGVELEGIKSSRLEGLFDEDTSSCEVLDMSDNTIVLINSYTEIKRTIHFKRAWLRVDGTSSYEKIYPLVNVEFDDGRKGYCLLDGDNDVGDTVIIDNDEGPIKGKILDKRMVYEDQLPFNLGQIYKCK